MLLSLLTNRFWKKEFQAMTLPAGDSLVKVYLGAGEGSPDITNHHCILCQDPFIIGVAGLNPDINNTGCFTIVSGANKAVLESKLINVTGTGSANLHLFEISTASFSRYHTILLLLNKWRSRSATGFSLFKKFAAAYMLPREVVLVSFAAPGHVNIFPMDFRGYFKDQGIHLFGLRNSNITLQKIIEHRRLAVAVFDSKEKSDIYGLGKHHSSAFSRESPLPFNITDTDLYKFPLADISTAYHELELVAYHNLGSHTLLIAKPVNKKGEFRCSNFSHIHTLEFMCRYKTYNKYVLQ
jgi:flavin reductase (DIM6/NTAB) family NADH-FMN oxidoreductase RutF